MREPGRTADPSAALGITKKVSRVLRYPTQAKTGLEWGTQRLLTMKQSKKVTTSQDDDSAGVLTKNTPRDDQSAHHSVPLRRHLSHSDRLRFHSRPLKVTI